MQTICKCIVKVARLVVCSGCGFFLTARFCDNLCKLHANLLSNTAKGSTGSCSSVTHFFVLSRYHLSFFGCGNIIASVVHQVIMKMDKRAYHCNIGFAILHSSHRYVMDIVLTTILC